MPTLYELPLKVLWIWNCNEAEMALDFQFKEDGKHYQVKGSGKETFDSKGDLKVCLTDNLDSIYFLNPNRKVYISNGDIIRKVWNYWKNESGEIRYNNLFKQLEKQKEDQEKSLFKQNDEADLGNGGYLTSEKIELTRKQVFDLVFEIEAIVGMLKAIKGEVGEKQIKSLVNNAANGFSKKSVNEVMEELKRKKILTNK